MSNFLQNQILKAIQLNSAFAGKADANGNPTNKFSVAESTRDFDAVPYTQLRAAGLLGATFGTKAAFNLALSGLSDGLYNVSVDESITGTPQSVYSVTAGAAVLVFASASASVLASPDAGRGASTVALQGSGTVQDFTSTDEGKGAALVGFPDPVAPAYLKVTSDIINGLPVHLGRFISNSSTEMAAVRARTSTTDHTGAFNTAISALAAAGGGELNIGPWGTWNAENIAPGNGVAIVGSQHRLSYPTVQRVTVKALGNGKSVFNAAGASAVFGLYGFHIGGPGSAVAGLAVNADGTGKWELDGITAANFADQAFLLNGTASRISRSQAYNCLLNRVRTEKSGVLHVTGNDIWITDCEMSASLSALTDANAYCVGIALLGSDAMMLSSIGELSDEGIYIGGSNGNNKIINGRSEFCFGNGWNIAAGSNQISNSWAVNPSNGNANTYDGFLLSATNNIINGCEVVKTAASAQHRYSFNDTRNSGSDQNRIRACFGVGYGTAEFNVQPFLGGSVEIGDCTPNALTANSANPAISGRGNFWRTANTVATSYTNFTGGISGQSLEILCLDAFSSLTSNATIRTTTGATVTMSLNVIYRFRNWNGVWYQVA